MPLQTIRDVARAAVVTAHPDDDAVQLARQMRDESVGSVVVVTDGHPLGIVTDRDLTIRVLADETTDATVSARELMTEMPLTIRDDLGVAAAACEMDAYGVRRLPVVDGGDELVGIVSLDDIYRELVREHEHLADVLAAESPE